MQLLCNGSSIPIAQMGPDYLILASAGDHPPCNASIVLKVDDSERRWDVHLPDGISARSKRVALSAPSPVTYPALRCPVAEFGASRAAEWQILAKRGDLDPM